MKLLLDGVSIALRGVRIVEDIDIEVHTGELVGLVGPNGSGKSTLLKAVYRSLRPQKGTVRLNGEDVWSLSQRESAKRTAAVLQEAPLAFDFMVAEVVALGRVPHQGPFEQEGEQTSNLVAQILERVGLAACAHRPFGTLSGGEKQRALIGRALVQEPKLLVLDEPTNHLDIGYQLQILGLVKQLGIATLIVLHDLNLAAAWCNRLYLLSHGHIVAEGPPEQALNASLISEVYGVTAAAYHHPISGVHQLAFVHTRDIQVQRKFNEESM
jgi:iron complex transport system ATP-binding protein